MAQRQYPDEDSAGFIKGLPAPPGWKGIALGYVIDYTADGFRMTVDLYTRTLLWERPGDDDPLDPRRRGMRFERHRHVWDEMLLEARRLLAQLVDRRLASMRAAA